MKPRLIIVSPRQYGYQTDYLKYVEYLPTYFHVVFLCVDQGEKKFACDNATIRYLKFGGKRTSYMWFMVYTMVYILFHQGKIMTANFPGCRILKKVFPWRKMAVNIRTVSVAKDAVVANAINARILKDAIPFDRIIMISKGGAEQLRLPMEKVDIVGLGADVISEVPKSYDSLRLFYVGTLTNRDIPKTVQGFHQYLLQSGDAEATYDIVGDGDELDEIRQYVREYQLSERILVHGRKRYDELKPFFDSCNIGVAFVPINEAYRYQPPTKTYEYILSGLYSIATRNQVHEETVQPGSGILIKDTAEAFCESLVEIKKRKIIESNVREGGKLYLWKTIVSTDLVNCLNKL